MVTLGAVLALYGALSAWLGTDIRRLPARLEGAGLELFGLRVSVAQAAILVASFVAMASATALLWTALAGHVSSLVRRPAVRRGFNRAGGGVLVGAGVALALKR